MVRYHGGTSVRVKRMSLVSLASSAWLTTASFVLVVVSSSLIYFVFSFLCCCDIVEYWINFGKISWKRTQPPKGWSEPRDSNAAHGDAEKELVCSSFQFQTFRTNDNATTSNTFWTGTDDSRRICSGASTPTILHFPSESGNFQMSLTNSQNSNKIRNQHKEIVEAGTVLDNLKAREKPARGIRGRISSGIRSARNVSQQ